MTAKTFVLSLSRKVGTGSMGKVRNIVPIRLLPLDFLWTLTASPWSLTYFWKPKRADHAKAIGEKGHSGVLLQWVHLLCRQRPWFRQQPALQQFRPQGLCHHPFSKEDEKGRTGGGTEAFLVPKKRFLFFH